MDKALNEFTGTVRRAVDDYNMIEEGDKIAVGVSGGKDSLILLLAMNHLKRFYPKKFELEAITIELGFEDMDFGPVEELCRSLDIPYVRISPIYVKSSLTCARRITPVLSAPKCARVHLMTPYVSVATTSWRWVTILTTLLRPI